MNGNECGKGIFGIPFHLGILKQRKDFVQKFFCAKCRNYIKLREFLEK